MSDGWVVVDVHGVGYKVYLPYADIARLPAVEEKVRLLVTTVVKEDSITLYGFLEESEQSLFEMLLTVNGIGPKVAMNLLSALAVQDIVGAVSSENPHGLSKVTGVGAKTAQRIVLELRDKITQFAWAQSARRTDVEHSVLDDAVEGLIALGYSRGDARQAAEAALKSLTGTRDTSSIVTTALKILSKG